MTTLSRVYRSRNCWLVQFSPSTCILHDTEAETTTSILNPDTIAADIHDGVWKPVPARAMLPPTLAAAIEGFVS